MQSRTFLRPPAVFLSCRPLARLGATLLGATLLLLPACRDQAPTEALPPVADSTMIQVLIELHLAEARASILNTDQTSTRDSILLRYGVDRDAFEAAIDYYARNPDAYVKIYSEALDQLSDERYLPPER